jgi:hypothetical protein
MILRLVLMSVVYITDSINLALCKLAKGMSTLNMVISILYIPLQELLAAGWWETGLQAHLAFLLLLQDF